MEFTPVLMGSAFKNKGVQNLLDAVTAYLPAPMDRTNKGLDISKGEEPIVLESDSDKPFVALAFKLEDGPYGQLTYLRIYQGKISKGDAIINSRTKRKHKVGRLARMHAHDMEDIADAGAGDIVALFGIDCASGDTFTDAGVAIAMTSMHVPDPVVSLAIKPVDQKSSDNLSKALGRFTREDPTFRAGLDPESNETVISGMGELHLEVYIERMKREYNCIVEAGQPQVAYRETITQRADFNYTHKKQTGGSGQYGRVSGWMEPLPSSEGDFKFSNKIRGGAIPIEFIPALEKGFKGCMEKGRLIGFPVIGVHVAIDDGQSHAVDSSEIAFVSAARGAFREAFAKAKPVALEPIMKLEVQGPSEFLGAMTKTVMQRRGQILMTSDELDFSTIEAEVPLAEMFGYATDLRSTTQGKAEFSMEFSRYLAAPSEVQKGLKEKYGSRIKDEE